MMRTMTEGSRRRRTSRPRHWSALVKRRVVGAFLGLGLLAGGCGGTVAPAATSLSPAKVRAGVANVDWPLLGVDPQRTDVFNAATGITATNAHLLRRRVVALPGTVDSSPIYLHGVLVHGRAHDVFVMTTTYGRTLAVDAASGRILWVFTPRSYGSYAGSYQFTTSTPAADPDRRHVYAAAPDGHIYKLSLADGREVRGTDWPVSITRLPAREKITGAINLTGDHVIAATGGYIGDQPPYQGHVVVIDRASGRIIGVFNTLCANLHRLLDPGRDCPRYHGSVWARDAVRVGANGDLLLATGRGHADDRTYFGNSVLEITPDARHIVGYWTPPDANQRDVADDDVGSSGPVLTGRGTVLQSGKDGELHVVVLGKPGREIQTLPAPGGSEMIAGYPAIWTHGNTTTIYLATDSGGTAAYNVRGDGTLGRVWENATPGTSPIIAGGLLYIYDPGGALVIYNPINGHQIARLPAGGGHWNAPVIGAGRIALPQGNANDHATLGTLNIYTLK